MQLKIPKELQKFVRMSKSEGLVHSSDMPEDLLSLFEKTKHNIEKAQTKRRNEMESMLRQEYIDDLDLYPERERGEKNK